MALDGWGYQWVKVQPAQAKAAAFLETHRYAVIAGVTMELTKLEGVAVNAKDKLAYFAMSRIETTMLAGSEQNARTRPDVDDIQLASLRPGAVYAAKLSGAIEKLLQQIISEHKAVIFNGNGYSAEWQEEAKRRGLPNLKATPEALDVLVTPKNIALFEKYGVLSEREMRSRYEIYLERYCKDINAEANSAVQIAKTMILPAGYRYQGELVDTASKLKSIGQTVHMGTLDKLTKLVGAFEQRIEALETALAHGGHDLRAEVTHFHDDVIPAMVSLRETADQIESILPDDLWPLPTYREMLFIK
jgi:glutamine synthetase